MGRGRSRTEPGERGSIRTEMAMRSVEIERNTKVIQCVCADIGKKHERNQPKVSRKIPTDEWLCFLKRDKRFLKYWQGFQSRQGERRDQLDKHKHTREEDNGGLVDHQRQLRNDVFCMHVVLVATELKQMNVLEKHVVNVCGEKKTRCQYSKRCDL